MAKIKKPLLFALCLLPVAAAAGIFVSLYQLDVLPEAITAEIVAQLGSSDSLILIGAVQSVMYTLFCAFFGYILADKIGLWKPVRFEKRSLLITLAVSVVGGIVFSLDHWVFGGVIEGIQSANLQSLTVTGVLASVLYGGIIEEVLLRLFFLSLIAVLLWKLFCRKHACDSIPPAVFFAANLIAALVFAAGHLPATISLFGGLTPVIVFRCFLLNGGFGLIFGWLYCKCGIPYAMLSHALFHIVSKLIWLVFA